jgi:hypothetical protein
MVPPGYYDLTIAGASHEQFVSAGTGGTPFEVANSIAGSATEVLFEVNLAGAVNVNYVHDGVPVPADQLATNMSTSVINTAGTTVTRRGDNPAFPRVSVIPETSTTVVAGDISQCTANDPQAWGETSTHFAGERIPEVAPDSGELVDVNVPVRTVEMSGWNGYFITAVSRNTSPGCSTSQKLQFTKSTIGNRLISLPYGHWRLYAGLSLGSTSGWGATLLDDNDFMVTGNDSIYRTSGDDYLLLEPRVRKP